MAAGSSCVVTDPPDDSLSDAPSSPSPAPNRWVGTRFVVNPKSKYHQGTKHLQWYGLDDEPQATAYLTVLREGGSYTKAAVEMGVRVVDVKRYRDEVPEFQELCDLALEMHRQDILDEAKRRAVEGYTNPIIGGRNKDTIVGEERKYSDSLMAMLLKKIDPDGFKDRREVAVTANVAASFDYSKYSSRVREQLRLLAKMVKEDDEARARGEILP